MPFQASLHQAGPKGGPSCGPPTCPVPLLWMIEAAMAEYRSPALPQKVPRSRHRAQRLSRASPGSDAPVGSKGYERSQGEDRGRIKLTPRARKAPATVQHMQCKQPKRCAHLATHGAPGSVWSQELARPVAERVRGGDGRGGWSRQLSLRCACACANLGRHVQFDEGWVGK